ncbi:MarR family transcriptional regulator [Mesorhizobium sp. CAU 1732]|uniref:MarR family winged helix-turn-helix transcriptional regulator n=1 Tax=Mesorhizobium sp. CAU 1732 TaxID=3140358 RepID=UPI003260AF76
MTNNRQPGNASGPQKFRDAETRTIEKAIRRIVRAHDLQSKALAKASGLTAAQLVLMKGMAELGEVTSAALSAYADISPATVVTVLDNLEERGLVQRYRSGSDRRIVHTRLTEPGMIMVAGAPAPLGPLFLERFARLDDTERRAIVEAAVRLADLLSRGGEFEGPAIS